MNAIWIALGIGSLVPLLLMRGLDARTSTQYVLGLVLTGAILTIPALLVETEAIAISKSFQLTPPQTQLVRAFLVFALLEEVVRYVAIDYLVRNHKSERGSETLMAAVWISMGFAVAENFYFVIRVPTETAIAIATLRTVLPTIMHICCGVIIASGQLRLIRLGPLSALCIAIAYHGLYDWIALAATNPYPALFLMIVFGLAVCGAVVRHARLLDAQIALSEGREQ